MSCKRGIYASLDSMYSIVYIRIFVSVKFCHHLLHVISFKIKTLPILILDACLPQPREFNRARVSHHQILKATYTLIRGDLHE
jgi:hypothetical protein